MKGVLPTHGEDADGWRRATGPSHDDRVHHLIAAAEEPIHPFADGIT